ncbi:hypothetical protein FB645_000326 [Coemansia sp. IMI 203386]|nr:hypothetical protein FB645_000326 [Coemansia sp. IMI 203386]
MDPVQALQTYINTATKFAFPALVVSVVLYYVSTAVSEAWRQRRRSRRQVTEDEKRRLVHEARLVRASEQQQSGQHNDEEKKHMSGNDRPNVIRSRLPASSRNQFGANVATLNDSRPRITGPSRSCVIGAGGSCCG